MAWVNRRRMGLLVALTAFMGVAPATSLAQDRIISPDSSVSMVLPATFHPLVLNPGATLQFGDSATESYVMVLLESKQDMVGWNLTRHSMITLAHVLASLDSPEVAGPDSLAIGGHEAVQYTVKGATQGRRIAYLHTTIDSPDNFAQVVAWTVASRWSSNEDLIREIVASIEIPAPAVATSTDVHELVAGTWAWESTGSGCSGPTQTFVVADDRKSMEIHHSEPIERANGSMESVTRYVIERSSPLVLHTFIPDESRLTEAGEPVKWDLVVIGRNRLAWHRADWPEGSFTGMLRRCDTRGLRP